MTSIQIGEAALNIGSVTMPAGEYYVGDPCYAVKADDWLPWLKDADFETPGIVYLLAEIEGKAVLGITTAYGDGEYNGTDGNSYTVDAGLIGVTPVSISDEGAGPGLQKVAFESAFICSYKEGLITIGHIEINTDEADGDWY